MAFTLIGSAAGNSTNSSTATCGPLDTRGATLIVLHVTWNYGGGPSVFTVSDSKGNVWTQLAGQQVAGGSYAGRQYYCVNPIVDAAHTFTLTTNVSTYPAIAAAAFAGVRATSPVDQYSFGTPTSAATVQPGPITPTTSSELLVVSVGGGSNAGGLASVDSGFTLLAKVGTVVGLSGTAGMAYQVQTAATTRNPTLTMDSTGIDHAAIIASFFTGDNPINGAPGFRISAAASLSAPAVLAGAASFALATAVSLSTAPAALAAASLIPIASAANLTTTARLSGAATFRVSAAASFLPPTINGAAGFRFGTVATIRPSPRATTVDITIDGVPVAGRVRMAGLTIRDILNDAPNTCTFVIEGDGPAVGQSIRITVNEGSRVLFAGQVQTVDQSFESLPEHVAWNVTGIDDTARANARRPFGTWVDTSATTIAQAIAAAFAPGFSVAGIEANLPPVSIVFDGSDTMIAALARLATAIGGYCKIEDGTIYLFTVDTAAAPDPIDATHRFLHAPAIQANVDSSQIRTRVFGKGYGEAIQADLAAGENLVPIQDGVTFPSFGGDAIVATTPDGAQSERIAFHGVELAAGGTLVGSGAGPTVAPALAIAAGAGVDNGRHDVAVVFVTASGKSLPGPFATITVPVQPAPTTAPVAGVALNGTGPDQGSHDYAVAFQTAIGETTPSPISNAIATSSAVGQIAAPAGSVAVQQPALAGAGLDDGAYGYELTFVNAQGETTPSGVNGWYNVASQLVGKTDPVSPGGPTGSFPPSAGGNLTASTYYNYRQTYTTALGESLPNNGNLLVLTDATYRSANVPLANSSDPRVTGRKLYRSLWPNGPFLLCGTIANNTALSFYDAASDASIASNPTAPTVDTTADPGHLEPFNRLQLYGIPTGPAGTTGRRIYRSFNFSSVFNLVVSIGDNTTTSYLDAKSNASLGAPAPISNTTGTAVQKIPVSDIPLGPLGVTARKLYRRFNGSGTFKLVTTIANNVTTTYTDAVPNSGLGAAALSTPTAIGNQIAVSGIPVGASAVTSRELYMSPVGTPVRKRALVISNNVDTTATIVASDAVLATTPGEPIADTSGLQQPQGQVNPGATVLPVAAAATFRPLGGWVTLAGGQVVRYTGISGQTLTGIPAAGPGAITTTVLYGSQALPTPMLTGVTGLGVAVLKGSAVHIWVQRDDLLAQAEQAARDGGDGIIEYLLVDTRRGLESLTARCDADLALFSRPLVTVAYATRDLKTKSGKTVAINLTSPRIVETLTIQEVTITEIDISPGLAPRFTVRASSVRFSLEDTLRRLIAGGPIAAGD